MPPLPVIANTFRCALRWETSIAALSAVNVIHIRRATAGATAADAFDALDDEVASAMWNTVGSRWSVSNVDITPLDGSSPTQTFTPTTASNWDGNTGGDVAPAVTSLVKLQTALRGRSFRGRLYLPSPAESQMGDGSLVDGSEVTGTAAWVTFANDLVARSPSWALVVASYELASAQQVINLSIGDELATQRKRQDRVRNG